MTRRWHDPNDARVLLVGLGACSLVGVLAVWMWMQPAPELRGAYTVHVDAGAPCTVEQWQAACDWWGGRGLEACTASPFAGEVLAVAYAGPEQGAHGRGVGALRDRVAVRPDRCGSCALVHELGHVYGLPDSEADGPMCGHPDRCRTTCRGLDR